MKRSISCCHILALDDPSEELEQILTIFFQYINNVIVELDSRVGCFQILMIELSVKEANECKFVIGSLTIGFSEDVAVAATLCIDVVEDVHISHLLEFDLSQEPI